MAGSMNRVILVGHLGKDPEVRNFQSGGRVVNIRMATSERWKNQAGEQQERTEWHSIAIFDEKLGEIAERYLKKGSLCAIEGQIETRKWQDKDGSDRYSTEIVLRPFRSLLTLLGDARGGDDRRDSGGSSSGSGWDRGGDRGAETRSGAGKPGGGGSAGRAWKSNELDDDIPF